MSARLLPSLARGVRRRKASPPPVVDMMSPPTYPSFSSFARARVIASATLLGMLACLPDEEPARCVGRKKQRAAPAAIGDDSDVYEVETIVARRLVKGSVEYYIKWEGYDEKHNSWEPMANLAGMEPHLALFEAEERKKTAEYNETIRLRQAKKQRQSTLAPLPAMSSSSSSSSTTAAGDTTADAAIDAGDLGVSSQRHVTQSFTGKRTSAIWGRYLAHPSKEHVVVCNEVLSSSGDNKKYGQCLLAKCGPTPLWNHHLAKHKRIYLELKGPVDPTKVDVAVTSTDPNQKKLVAYPFSKERKDECDLACARWLVKSARPLTLPERDQPFRDFIDTLTRGGWNPPNPRNVADKILQMSAKGQHRVSSWFDAMVVDGVKPSLAGDIWSHKGCSLMGVTIYGINSGWKIQEWLVSASPFGANRHTGEAIDAITVESLKRHGIKWRHNGTVYEAIHGKVSDNASNMAKGWSGFQGGFCAAHTLELSVKAYTKAPGIIDVLARAKGIVAYFSRSTSGIQDLHAIQRSLDLPQKKPVLDVATRWFSSYEMLLWFHENQKAVQMYDVQHGAEALKNDAYKSNRMHLDDWTIVDQSVAALKAAAQVTKMLEGTKYVTISLVLPSIYRLIEGTGNGPLFLPWKSPATAWISELMVDQRVRHARAALHKDLVERWLNNMPDTQRSQLDIATLLDPRFKDYKFPGLQNTDLDDCGDIARRSLQMEWQMNWKPTHPSPPSSPELGGDSSTEQPAPAAKDNLDDGRASSIFSAPLAPTNIFTSIVDWMPRDSQAGEERVLDDLDKYEALPAEMNMDLDVLQWWRLRDHCLPPDPSCGRPAGLPTLAKMARQFLGRPASSAGVERMFSKAGKLHDDVKASQSDETLEHALLAAVNCD